MVNHGSETTLTETSDDDSHNCNSSVHRWTGPGRLDSSGPVVAGGQGRSAASLEAAVSDLLILFLCGVAVIAALIISASFPLQSLPFGLTAGG